MNQVPRREHLPSTRVRSALGRFLSERLKVPRGAGIANLKWRGEGLFYTVFAFGLADAGARSGSYVIRVVNPGIKDEGARDRMVRASRLLELLDPKEGLAPECLGSDETGEYLGLPFTIETFIEGIPLSEAPKEPQKQLPLAARELARVHQVLVSPRMHRLFPTREPFAEGELERTRQAVKGLPETPEVLSAALEVAIRLRPSPREPRLLHGDPLLQNLILRIDFERRDDSYVWIDWEFARLGDPAYDLSIFTRGQFGNLYGLKGGRSLYRDAYQGHSGIPVEEERLLFYELLLVIRRTGDLIREGRNMRAQEEGRRLEKLVLRARKS